MSKLYVAYGSNLNVNQMNYRCPNSKIKYTGILENWRLAFKGGNNSYLTIEECEGKTCPVVVWEISDEDEISLDLYEGYPSFYYKRDINVKLEDETIIEGMVYIMDSKYDFGTPSSSYYNTVICGYFDCGISNKIPILTEAFEYSEGKERERLMNYYKSLKDKGLTDEDIFGYEYQ